MNYTPAKHVLLHLIHAHHVQARSPKLSSQFRAPHIYSGVRSQVIFEKHLAQLKEELSSLVKEAASLNDMLTTHQQITLRMRIEALQKKIEEKEKERRGPIGP